MSSWLLHLGLGALDSLVVSILGRIFVSMFTPLSSSFSQTPRSFTAKIFRCEVMQHFILEGNIVKSVGV